MIKYRIYHFEENEERKIEETKGEDENHEEVDDLEEAKIDPKYSYEPKNNGNHGEGKS